MSSDRGSPHHHLRRQSIPLQDLSRPPDTPNDDDGWGDERRSFIGRRRGSLLGNRQPFRGRVSTTGRYERVVEGSPERATPGIPHVTTPRIVHQAAPYDDGEVSPVNPGDFQTAMGSVGLSFDNTGPPMSRSPAPSTLVSGRRASTLNVITESDTTTPFAIPVTRTDTEENSFSPTENDMTPLTDTRFLQPMSGAPATAPSASRHSRSTSRLGDDLINAEAGLRPPSTYSARSMSRSLSVSGSASPLSRAGTMVRKMSQRVVNLSNEPEIVEQSIRRQPARDARLEAPPSFPAYIDYGIEDPADASTPLEKSRPHVVAVCRESDDRTQNPNPLKGKSLGVFPPNNWIRLRLCEMLVHPVTEPIILILIFVQTIVLAVDSAPKLSYKGRPKGWGSSWVDFALLVLFVIYTVEIFARVLVSGFVKNAEEYSTVDWDLGIKRALIDRCMNFFVPHRQQQTAGKKAANTADPAPSIIRTFTSTQAQIDQPGHTRQQQRVRLARRAFLRHGFNRLDFVAVVSFWISFALDLAEIESWRHIYVFRMLSCLRILRLLGLTSGTSVILRSLKRAAPLLVNVAFLIGFFWLLFAIVGVQSFKSSFRRSCVWFDDIEKFRSGQPYVSYSQNVAPGNNPLCGGYINATTGDPWPWLKADGITNGTHSHKGYLCPRLSLCLEGDNPYNGTVSFDNILQSLQLVFVIMSSNTFSDILYYMTNSDFLAAALYFAFGIVIMSLWLMNLLVAVITSSFQVIREESKTSAFTTDDEQIRLPDEEMDSEPIKRVGPLMRYYEKTYWLWIIIIVFDLVVQALRSADMGPSRENFINKCETVVTLVLIFEICLRFLCDWRNFHTSPRNWVDLVLAVITAIMQLPSVHRAKQPYAWLTFFQIVRIYRVVLAVSLTRQLILTVLGNVTGLLNLVVFVFLITFLTAIFAVQIFRGQFPENDSSGTSIHVTFSDIYNSFIGMYQVLSSENWTILMYNSTQYEFTSHTSWIGATFFVLWFILANFIVLNMFIAVIQENFDVTEDEKRLEQVKAFLHQKELSGSSHGNLSLSTIFKFGRDPERHRDPLDYGPATMDMLTKDAVVRDFLDKQLGPADDTNTDATSKNGDSAGTIKPGPFSAVWGKMRRVLHQREPNPFYSRLQFSRAYDELDPRTMAREVVSAQDQRKRAQRQYLQEHPTYNVSLFIFRPNDTIRRFCQRIVGPGRGSQRIQGVDPLKPVWYSFSAFIYAAIVAMVLLACISTPLYQKEYSELPSNRNWYVWTDLAFAMIFTIEAIVKVIADGFFWTPNAYFRGSWGFIDGLVLITLWINVAASLSADGVVSRAVGAFKALRALRLLNVSDSARDTFHSVIILGGWKVVSAAFVSLSLLIPFAIYGLNIFNGQLLACNDNSNQNLSNCVGEFDSTPFNWNVLSPRQVANPYYNFDNFGSSLSILFQIVSQEGWIDVMWSAMSAAGIGNNPSEYQSQGNAVFFIIFNLLGSVFVLTLFVSVFMRNYTEQTGVAFLTAEQRSWLELRKLLRQISPSKRPSQRTERKWRLWCYRIAVKKHGKWQRFVTGVLFLHLILLLLEFYPEVHWWESIRNYLFLAFTLIYITNIAIRIAGLTWTRFRRSSWDLYALFSVLGTVITTLLTLPQHNNNYNRQLHKYFLVSIALLLIPRNNQLDQLFKTAAACFTAIANLLATWVVLFLVYAIALTQIFGLTRFGAGENGNLNFRNVPKALILLFRMSCGEGWNTIMEDFAKMEPPNCVFVEGQFSLSDCGSAAWARTLFISWNILSMYIFVSLFVSLIFESFSYVYQRSSGMFILSRNEIRRFKQAWATFDPDGTGYISKETFPRLLGELSGVFEMRIYKDEHSVYSILQDCKVEEHRGTETPPPGVVHGVDLVRLNDRLRTIDVEDIQRRRQRLELFFQEVIVHAPTDRGVNFTACLMILAHHNIISDSKSLKLEEFLRRRARLQRVEEEVNRRIVKGFFDTMFWSRQFRSRLDLRHSARMTNVPQFAVPEIFVDDQDVVSPQDNEFSPQITSASNVSPQLASQPGIPISDNRSRRSTLDSGRLRRRDDSRTPSPAASDRSYTVSPQLAPQRQSLSVNRLSLSAHRPSHSGGSSAGGSSGFQRTIDDISDPGDARPAARSRAASSVNKDVLQVFDESAWGESIRRSFTLGRNGTRRRRGGGSSGGT